MKYIFFLLMFLLTVPDVRSQNNDTQAAVFNIASGGFIGGVGAVINKKRDEKTLKVFGKGFYQGALGGYLVFESKRLISNLAATGNYNYGWPSKILNSAGNSIVVNAASNRNFWEKWQLNFGFNYMEYDFKSEKKFKYRVMPFALVSVAEGFARGSLDLDRSLALGQFVFRSNEDNPDYLGQAFANTLKYVPNRELTTAEVLTHEMIHVYQYQGTFGFNSYLDKPVQKLKDDKKWFKIYSSIFYTDFNYIVNTGFNVFDTIFSIPVEQQIDEKEAFYYQFRNNYD
ncbi:hypothetical protein [Costertonia aggregata]|uniref:Uncharacterized protein n=1 Tax=Costertonia aggregata TaxID=343403 RepID=A0A7H9AN46_9FLAO|nr:hypothetical protein [Costertonia aggregata]QLG44847.1 hypothetical protein HYG79_05600 [Costertonia aggregata]